MKIFLIILVVVIALILGYMRYNCIGLWSGVDMHMTDIDGNSSSKFKCEFHPKAFFENLFDTNFGKED